MDSGIIEIGNDLINNKVSYEEMEFKNFEYLKKKLDKEFIIEDLYGQFERNVIILANKVLIIKNKKYIQLIALDVYTGKIVKIVDTNGKKYGLLNYSQVISNLKDFNVIKSTFQLLDNTINTFRVTSEISFLGKSNLIELRDKYNYIYNLDIVKTFKSIFNFATNNIGKTFYSITRFSSTELKNYKTKNGINKYQFKMNNTFVDIENININLSTKIGLFFRGLALLSIKCISENKFDIRAINIYGKFYNKDRIMEIRENFKYPTLDPAEEVNEINKSFLKDLGWNNFEEYLDFIDMFELYEEAMSENIKKDIYFQSYYEDFGIYKNEF